MRLGQRVKEEPDPGGGHRRRARNIDATGRCRSARPEGACRGAWPLGLIAVAALALGGCSTVPEHPAPEPEICQALLTELDHAISTSTHFEPGLRRIDGHPLLRTNRFLASFTYDELLPNARTAWLGHAFELGRDAYAVESTRLDRDTRQALADRHDFTDLDSRLSSCFLATSPPEALDTSTYRVPDSYSSAARILGLYPVTGLVARGFIAGYRRDMTARYLAGRATRFERRSEYSGPQAADPSALLPVRLDTDALGIPRLSAVEQDALFRRFMPQVVVEQRSDADRIGAPRLDEQGRIEIDTTRPVVFTFPSHPRLGSRILLQLNYAFWFPERPPEHGLDLYAGDLSGILWRVTLDHELRPVLYDSIHQCGCYHKLFIPAGSRIDLEGLDGERPLTFPLPPGLSGDRGLRLRLEAGSHYIIDVGEATPSASTEHYALEDYASQLQLPAGDSARSLFGTTGVIQQSQRPERLLLWPLGVPSAGAMRQRGLHAIAFVGRRHFDDPDLLEALGFTFEPR